MVEVFSYVITLGPGRMYRFGQATWEDIQAIYRRASQREDAPFKNVVTVTIGASDETGY